MIKANSVVAILEYDGLCLASVLGLSNCQTRLTNKPANQNYLRSTLPFNKEPLSSELCVSKGPFHTFNDKVEFYLDSVLCV